MYPCLLSNQFFCSNEGNAFVWPMLNGRFVSKSLDSLLRKSIRTVEHNKSLPTVLLIVHTTIHRESVSALEHPNRSQERFLHIDRIISGSNSPYVKLSLRAKSHIQSKDLDTAR